jgi:hypothetical protein
MGLTIMTVSRGNGLNVSPEEIETLERQINEKYEHSLENSRRDFYVITDLTVSCQHITNPANRGSRTYSYDRFDEEQSSEEYEEDDIEEQTSTEYEEIYEEEETPASSSSSDSTYDDREAEIIEITEIE